MAAASGLAETPGRLENVFLNPDNSLSPNGIYGVNLYTLGVKHTVIVDDWLPLYGNSTLFAHLSDDGGIWGSILEKAFSKYHGNYEHTIGGDPSYAVRTLTGYPREIFSHGNTDDEALWTKIQNHHAEDIITSGTPYSSGGHDDSNAQGLAMTHAYTLIGSAVLSDGTRLIQMRNPWGSEGWFGDWSDESDKWTDAFKAEVAADPHVTEYKNDK